MGQPYNGLGVLSGVIVRYDVGQAFGSFYGYVADGLFQTPEDVHAARTSPNAHPNDPRSTAPGDIRFKDLNGDGIINAHDRTFIGSPNPDFTYGINNTLTWKGFDLNVFLQGSQGNQIYNQNRYILESPLYGNSSGSTRVLDRWTGPGTSNDGAPRHCRRPQHQPARELATSWRTARTCASKPSRWATSCPQIVLGRISAKQMRAVRDGPEPGHAAPSTRASTPK